ncbi:MULTISPECIES: IucA/IucC family protein [Streptomyces]|uniref:IucA/IucC family siderophore biosynthesis protein n=1 Tax=Streptomyces glycanivorans TaxID=3033808 RepID=A0ABY9JBS7_9ACTN|nr:MULTISPECIES: IucA/IucC family siderophore biosynthesis protein [unclassified Streptomyces]WLQ63748.1 IucA/IucC family siderophore biosynthesis protein [Streptomyces sp. Alt3]WSQ84465.1 IucA/IucC family siderophore biosynthesis protein [Streptomyces sp. NBC_01212]WSR09481.1 IucA/IucC family siderophore biosynthesis protein [Streptomyces sp. NBC_01208]WSR47791.1 IucA/IucC family siderophore biosynthesis protein [Streptomyces sp. NBC_01201]
MPAYPASHHQTEPHTPTDAPELNRTVWDRASARLLAKMLGEFAYEEVIEPLPRTGDGAGPSGDYAVRLDDGATLVFRARRGVYGGWRVDPATIREVTGEGLGDRAEDGAPFRDPLRFLARGRGLLGLDGATLAHLIRELTATLAADARLEHTALGAAQLAELPYAELEGHQTGHPWLVANKGRIGFSSSDAARFTPEARSATVLPWIAVSTRIAGYRGVGRVTTPEDLYGQELDPDVRESFATILRGRGLDPVDYLFLPVHPWQWDEWVVPLFAPAIADGDVVHLHADADLRLPQQSIRTFTNVGRPDRHTVKLPLSILNTLVWRGLPTERTLAAPAVTAWVQGLCESDPFLRDTCGVILLGEVASVAVEHPLYDHLPESPYQFKEILGAIWREPLQPRLAPGERARTLASLLHTDPDGRSFTAELVTRSGLDPEAWLTRLFAALLPPLLHFLYRYGTVFSPHGENAIVVFDDNDVPVRLAIKDFVDDVNVSARALPEHDTMPADVRAVLLTEDPSFLTQFIHSGLFVGVFRYLSPLCEEQLGVPEGEFWSLVRAEVLRHHARFPDLKERFEIFDMLTPTIDRLCLNRNRLHLDGYRDRPERPHAAVHGTVPNPLHPSA